MIIALVVGLALSTLVACAASEDRPYIVDFRGEHRFFVGDDPAFAEPEYDDSGWGWIDVPGGWTDLTPAAAMTRWYRIHFELPPGSPTSELAVDLGVVSWADETFLNGRRIGATGSLDRFPDAVYVPRLYSVPADALRLGSNVLAIRHRGWPFTANGLVSEGIGIGKELLLAPLVHREIRHKITAEAILMGFLACTWLVVAFFPKRGRIGRASLYLWLAVTMMLVHVWLFSLSAHYAGLTLRANTAATSAALNFGAAATCAFVGTLTRERMPRFIIAFIIVLTAMGVLSLVAGDLPERLVFVGVAVFMLGVVAMTTLLVAAVRARTPGVIPLLLGYSTATGCGVAIGMVSHPFALGLVGLGSVAACWPIALARQVQVMNERAQRASEYALAAHASERTRLARDLHDGLGQMLALLKMQLQRTGRKLGTDEAADTLDAGVAQADATLEELRRIARDLRPIPMQDRRFGEAVREYAASIARRTDLEVEVEGDYPGELPAHVADELYRIVQECLTNALKHAHASRVVVSLDAEEKCYSLSVTDDGRGLPEQPRAPGLGLQNIRERSELLGGSCALSTPDGGGTRVTVTIPTHS